MVKTTNSDLQKLLDNEIQKKHTHSVLLGIQSKDSQLDFAGAAGNVEYDNPYFIASITKMYTTVRLMQLVDNKLLDLDAPLTTYLPPDLIDGVHVYKGVDYSHQLKVYQLMHQTSGLADYFEDKPQNGDSLMDGLKQGKDREYATSDVMAMVRNMKPKFAPDANNGRKSHYSDTNYQLLGAIIESITGKSLADNFHTHIFDHCGLEQTYLYDHKMLRDGQQPIPFYNKDQVMVIPKTMSSVGPDGGIVSTLPESLAFLRAYFEGKLFDSGHFDRMMARWNTVFFPIQYGYGLMRFQLPRIMTLFQYSPEFIGHFGSSGSFAFYAPKEELYIAGTLNQVDNASRPFKFMLKVMNAVK